MPRWVVPSRTSDPDIGVLRAASDTGAAIAVVEEPKVDTYADKLVKYVPAEVLAFVLPAAALNAGEDTWLHAILFAGLVATPLYHFVSSRSARKKEQPRAYFYPLAALAFLPWALGASTAIGGMTGLGQARITTVLMFSVLIVPLFDGLLAWIFPPVAGSGV